MTDSNCWVESARDHADFPVTNLPLGVFSHGDDTHRIGVAIGDEILCLKGACEKGLIEERFQLALTQPNLNAWFGHEPSDWSNLRAALIALLTDEEMRARVEPLLVKQSAATMHMPARVGDYTDFYVGIHHATNVGKLFRPDNPLLPNYKHIPIGYHGRASSVRVSGEHVVRPVGQRKTPDQDAPDHGPARRLDYELEMGIWVGRGNELGQTIPIGEAEGHIAGYCLLNDWSARDLQAWEYQPLGPFLAKSFITTVSPWVVTNDALAPYRKPMPARPEGDPTPLDYLMDADDQAKGALDIQLEATLTTEKMRANGDAPHVLSRGTAAAAMYWSAAQIVTHHASNGCNLQPGDLIGTGTLSTSEESGLGSMLEISNGGKKPISLGNGETRTFLEDGDEIVLTAWCENETGRIGFGSVTGRVLSANG